MADFQFNNVKGKTRYYFELPAANDALIVVLLKSTGLEADATLRDYNDLLSLLAGTSDEADFTNYTRKTVATGITINVDNTNDRVDVDVADITWVSAGGATNNTLGKLLVCYDPDTTTGTDSTVVPLLGYDYVETTSGSDITAQVNAVGLIRFT